MKVYLISKGEHSDYHICAVTLDPQEAEKLRDIYSDHFYSAEIEEYDTESHRSLLDGFRFFNVIIDNNGTVRECKEADDQDAEEKIYRDGYLVSITVFAKDFDDAVKNAFNRFKKFLVEGDGRTRN